MLELTCCRGTRQQGVAGNEQCVNRISLIEKLKVMVALESVGSEFVHDSYIFVACVWP